MRRNFSPLIGLLMAAALLAAVPAAFAAAPDRLPFVGSSAPGTPVVSRPVDIAAPDVPPSIRARCVGSVGESGSGSVECNWRAREDLGIAGWQLWNLQVRPAHGERNLVAELRTGVTSYTDTNVEIPGQYFYVVLGLDADGDIIARSGVAPATLEKRPTHDDPMRLECGAADLQNPSASIGCEWSPTKAETAAGYVLWRSVGGDDRMVVARTGLEAVRFVDADVAAGHRYVYVITAVDAGGEVVGRSRPDHAGIPGSMNRPVDPVEVRPVGHVEVRPVHPVEVGPMPTQAMASGMSPAN